MALRTQFAVVIFLILRSWTTVHALRCYNCSSLDNYKCGDPFDNREFSTIECKTYCFKTVNSAEVTRGCLQTAYYTYNDDFQCVENAMSQYNQDVECVCHDLTCNKSSTRSVLSAILVTLLIVIAVLHSTF